MNDIWICMNCGFINITVCHLRTRAVNRDVKPFIAEAAADTNWQWINYLPEPRDGSYQLTVKWQGRYHSDARFDAVWLKAARNTTFCPLNSGMCIDDEYGTRLGDILSLVEVVWLIESDWWRRQWHTIYHMHYNKPLKNSYDKLCDIHYRLNRLCITWYFLKSLLDFQRWAFHALSQFQFMANHECLNDCVIIIV